MTVSPLLVNQSVQTLWWPLVLGSIRCLPVLWGVANPLIYIAKGSTDEGTQRMKIEVIQNVGGQKWLGLDQPNQIIVEAAASVPPINRHADHLSKVEVSKIIYTSLQ